MKKMMTSIMSMLLVALFVLGGTGCSAGISEWPIVWAAPAETRPAAPAPVETNAPETGDGTDDVPMQAAPAGFASVEAIGKVAGLQAECQTKESACAVFIEGDGNHYDVEWNYGEDYEAYVAACDWGLVFDAGYYKATFPVLAMLYHDNDIVYEINDMSLGVATTENGYRTVRQFDLFTDDLHTALNP